VKKFVAFALTTLIAAATVAPILPGPVFAQELEIEIDRDGPKVRLNEGYRCDPRYERCHRGRWDERQGRRFCTEERALSKAERLGVRRARIVSANRRVIVVRGRDRYGDRIRIVFGRERYCPVLN